MIFRQPCAQHIHTHSLSLSLSLNKSSPNLSHKTMEQSTNDTNRDENGSNRQQISDSRHQHHHQQQQDMQISDRQQTGGEHQHSQSGNGQHRSSPQSNAQHISGHSSPDANDAQHNNRNAIIDAHTHVITETPHNTNLAHEHHLKKEGQHSPSQLVDHSGHRSPVQELTQAAVGHSLDDKSGVNEALHLYGYHSGHQQHHQTRYALAKPYLYATHSTCIVGSDQWTINSTDLY